MKKRGKVEISNLEKRNYKWIYWFLLPSVAVFIVFYLQPIITVFYTSLTKWDGFNSPKFIGFQNYIDMFANNAFLISLKNIILWSVISSTFHMGFGVLVAFILYHKPKGWKLTRGVFMIPNVISAAAWAMIYKFIFNDDMGILNNIIRKFNPDFHVQW